MSMCYKALYCSLGWLFFAIGVIGAFLPVLPTTPFMILALWMFSKGSQRFHNWLYNHKFFGPPLQRWHEHRVIPRTAKLMSVSMISLSFAFMLMYSPSPWWLHLLTGLLMAYGAWFVLTKPSEPPPERAAAVPENS